MSSIIKIALACSTLVALTLAASPAGAAAPKTATGSVAANPPTAPAKTAAEAATAGQNKKVQTKLKMAPNETVIYVGDLHCKHCAKKIASKLYAVKGVVKVRTDLKADVAIVTPQTKKKLDPLALWSAAKNSGFPAVKLVGPAGTYLADPKTKAAQLQPKKPVASKS